MSVITSDCDTMWILVIYYEHYRIILRVRYTASVGREENVMQLIAVERKNK